MDNKTDIIPAFMKTFSGKDRWLKGKPKKKKKTCNDFKELKH